MRQGGARCRREEEGVEDTRCRIQDTDEHPTSNAELRTWFGQGSDLKASHLKAAVSDRGYSAG
jgi:hypothetical protein